MMEHNDENLKSFLARDSFKSSIAGTKKLMKDMKDSRDRPNEIVASKLLKEKSSWILKDL